MPPAAAKSMSKRSLNRRCAATNFCRRWKLDAAKSTSKKRPEPARIMALLVAKPATLYYAGGRKKAVGMEPKRSCICRLGEAATRRKAGHLYYAAAGKAAKCTSKRSCIRRLGEAAGIALSPKTTS
jgi:hypothetical protein